MTMMCPKICANEHWPHSPTQTTHTHTTKWNRIKLINYAQLNNRIHCVRVRARRHRRRRRHTQMANSGAYYFIDVIWCVCVWWWRLTYRVQLPFGLTPTCFQKTNNPNELHANLGNPNDFLCPVLCVNCLRTKWVQIFHWDLVETAQSFEIEIEHNNFCCWNWNISHRRIFIWHLAWHGSGWVVYVPNWMEKFLRFDFDCLWLQSKLPTPKRNCRKWKSNIDFELIRSPLTCSHADARHSTRIWRTHIVAIAANTFRHTRHRHEQFEMQNFVYIFNVLFQLINSRIKCLTPSFVPFHSVHIFGFASTSTAKAAEHTFSNTFFPFARTGSVPRSAPPLHVILSAFHFAVGFWRVHAYAATGT